MSKWLAISTSALVVLFGPMTAQSQKAGEGKNDFSTEWRYGSRDVRHTFHTQFDETIDCIDFSAQPGVKALQSRGITVPVPSEVKGPTVSQLNQDDPSFHGQLDEYGSPMECPAGTVPIIRITSERVAQTGGRDRLLESHGRKGPGAFSARAPQLVAAANYAHIVATSSLSGILAGTVTMNAVEEHTINGPNHNISQVWAASTQGAEVETVEVGLNISRALYGSMYNLPHLFTFSTSDSYNNGCYNNVGANCVPWIGLPGSGFTPGMVIPHGVGENQAEITISVWRLPGAQAGWHVFVASGTAAATDMGYWPASNYSTSLATAADEFQVGGEIYDETATWLTRMGRGTDPRSGHVGAAYLRSFFAWSNATGTCNGSTANGCWSLYNERPEGYTYVASGLSVPTGWTNYFFVGNAPHLFTSDNYGFSWSPIGDWAVNNYKANCPQGYPVIGISKSASTTTTLAVRCGTRQVQTGSAAGCYSRTVGQAENRGSPGYDWASGRFKTDCAPNEFVQGIAQTTSGQISAILCCQINGSLDPYTDYSPTPDDLIPTDPYNPDWHVGALKAECEEWYNRPFVAGVATHSPYSGGTPGAVSNIRCRSRL